MHKTVCLVNPPWIQRQQSIWENVEGRTLPFGLGYVAAVLERDSRADISIVDAKADELTPEKTVQEIVETSPDVVGISSCTYDYPDAVTLARMVKEKAPDVITCFGGYHASALPELTLKNPWVDFVVRGEGEYTFLELIQGAPPQQIKGLSYKHHRKIVHNPARPLMENLDDLPRLSYHLLPMEKYYPTAGQCRRSPAAAMVVSRGCPGVCIFCCSSVTGRHIRRFSPERILNEIQFLVENYGIREIVFMDDTMTHPREELIQLCNLLTQKELGVIWDCSTRVTAVDQSLLQLMKKAGSN